MWGCPSGCDVGGFRVWPTGCLIADSHAGYFSMEDV